MHGYFSVSSANRVFLFIQKNYVQQTPSNENTSYAEPIQYLHVIRFAKRGLPHTSNSMTL